MITASKPTHIDDAVGYFKCCSDTFGQIAAILASIQKEMEEPHHLRTRYIKGLAGAGFYLANDFENLADCWREEIKANGIRMK